MKDFIKYLYKKIYQKANYDVHKSLLLNAKILAQLNNQKHQIDSLDEVEFQVFSQRGEDGIIQYILGKIEVPNKVFVEFGVETYTESNTRYLLLNNWSGLVIDGSVRNINFIKNDFVYWKYNLTAIASFITKDNINDIIKNYTKEKTDIGLLSVDIDGNDYWVWQKIECINPRIVVCEYNSAFGAEKKLTVPYQEDFVRAKAHYSELYFGASLAAFCHLAEQKGYDFIGTSSAGVNAYFVRKDLSTPFIKHTSLSGYNETHNRDSKGQKGELTFLPHNKRLELLKELPLVEVETNQVQKISDWF
jgi:hypothetical protein